MLPPLEDCRTLFKESAEAFEMVLCSGARRKPFGFAMRVLVTRIVEQGAGQALATARRLTQDAGRALNGIQPDMITARCDAGRTG
jgi:hypothetical protein